MNNRAGLIAAIVIIIALVAGASYFIGSQANTTTSNDNANQNQNQQATTTPTPSPTSTNATTPSPTPAASMAMPDEVRDSIASEYPDYHIDDIDRETEAGVEYYEVELDHNSSDSEINLYYDLEWNFVRAERD